MKYAHIDINNQILGWYDSEIHETIPTPNIEVEDEQWQTALDNGHNTVAADGSTSVVDYRTQADLDTQAVAEAKAYLAETDWVIVKINEASIQGQDTTPLLTQYADVLIKRKDKRVIINQLGDKI